MKRNTAFLLSSTVAVATLLVWRLGAPCDRGEETPADFASAAAGTVLLDLRDDLSVEQQRSLLDSIDGERLNSRYSADEQIYLVDLTDAQLRALRADNRIEHLEPNVEYAHLGEVSGSNAGPQNPDDPLYAFQWHFDQIGLERAWKTSGGDGVVVAVIDTGVAYTTDESGAVQQVLDLAGTGFVPGYDFVDDDDVPLDLHGHGTHVAGTIAQTTNNGYGVAGIAPAARIMPLRVLDAEGRGTNGDIADSIRFAANNGAHVINLSLGGPLPSRILNEAIQYARSRGVIVIAAAGNSGSSVPSYPAAYPGVVSVAATQFDRTATFYSNWGRHLDIAAPGGNTRVDQNADGRPDGVLQETLARGNPREHEFALYMGTSMAAPHVAGVAALVRSSGVTHPDRIEEILLRTADSSGAAGDPARYGAGILSADRAVQSAVAGDHVPRGVLALLLPLLLAPLAAARRVSLFVAGGTAALLVAGLAPLAAMLGLFGIDPAGIVALSGTLPELATSRWPAVTGNLFVMSAIPVIAIYAFAGSIRGRVARGLVVGAMSGLTAWMFTAGIAPRVDLLGLPGHGLLDSAWLLTNAAIAGAAVWAALRPSDSASEA